MGARTYVPAGTTKAVDPGTCAPARTRALNGQGTLETWKAEFTGPGTAVRCVPPHFNPCNVKTISLFPISLQRLLIMLFNNLVVYARTRLRRIAYLSYTLGSLNLLPSLTLVRDRYTVRFICFYVYLLCTTHAYLDILFVIMLNYYISTLLICMTCNFFPTHVMIAYTVYTRIVSSKY